VGLKLTLRVPLFHIQFMQVKHIPRAARPHMTSELVYVLDKILSDPDDITQLRAPVTMSRRHNWQLLSLSETFSKVLPIQLPVIQPFDRGLPNKVTIRVSCSSHDQDRRR
jgi:hypothetical protein